MKKKLNIKVSFSFYEYLQLFYNSNRKQIRSTYKKLSQKFLDYNDPQKGSVFLRPPQFEALEIYIFLKEYLKNKAIHEIFNDWYNKQGGFEERENKGMQGDSLFSFFRRFWFYTQYLRKVIL